MVDLQEVLWGFSIISLSIYFVQGSSKLGISKFKASAKLINSFIISWFGLLFYIQEKSLDVLGSDSDPQLGSDRKGGVIFNEESNYLGLMAEIETASINSKGSSSIRMKKRPTMLLVPAHDQYCPADLEIFPSLKKKEFEIEIEGRDFFLASRKGKREIMEDSYSFMVDILGDPKQVIDSLLIIIQFWVSILHQKYICHNCLLTTYSDAFR